MKFDDGGMFDPAPSSNPAWGSPPPLKPTPYLPNAPPKRPPITSAKLLLVLDTIRRAGPAGITDEEIATLTGLSPNTARPRRIDLLNLGMIRRQGTRVTLAGNSATAWVTTRAAPSE